MTGHFTISPQYDDINIQGNLAFAKFNNKHYILRLNGERISEGKLEYLEEDSGGGYIFENPKHLILISNNGKYGFINNSGKIVTPLIFDKISGFYGGIAIAENDYKLGLIDKNGRIIIKPTYLQMRYFHDGKAAISNNEKMGYIDINGSPVVALDYTVAHDYSNQMAWASKIEGDKFKYFLLDFDGKVIIEEYFSSVNSFENETAIVFLNMKGGLIDKWGKILVPFEYEKITKINDSFFAMYRYGTWQIFNRNSLKTNNFTFSEFYPSGNNNVIIVKNDKLWGIYELDKGYIVDPIYDKIF